MNRVIECYGPVTSGKFGSVRQERRPVSNFAINKEWRERTPETANTNCNCAVRVGKRSEIVDDEKRELSVGRIDGRNAV
jgi:hypothetical protein